MRLLSLLSFFLLIVATYGKVKEYHIAFSSDDGYRPGVEKCIRSIQEHASEKIHFHYIGFHPLENIPDVNFVDLNVIGEKYQLSQFFNPFFRPEKPKLNSNLPNYARYVLHQIFPNISKVLYLDADTEVMCDIVPLFNDYLKRHQFAVAAVPRGGVMGLLDEGKEIAKRKDILVSFNAGVMMFDLERWRELEMTQQIRTIAQQNQLTLSIYEFGSQPPLALALGNDFEHLPEKWNYMDRKCLSQIYPGEICCLFHSRSRTKDWETSGPFGWLKKLF